GEAGQKGMVSFARLMVENFSVPAVLGWGRSVSDTQASVAAEIIYRELSRGRSLVEAVQRARRELVNRFMTSPQPAWPLLRLFCRTTASAPMVKKGQKAKPKPRSLTHRYLQNSRVIVLAEGFVGRRRQLQQCARVLRKKEHKIGLLIQGTGGLGKSCLAGKVCERFAGHRLVVVHGPLNDISLQKALEQAFTIAQDKKGKEILGEKKEMSEKLKDLCAVSFAENNYFIILDDFEQNLEVPEKGQAHRLTVSASQLLAVLLVYGSLAGKETQVLITSRYGFGLHHEGEDLVGRHLELVTLTALLPAEQQKKIRELRNLLKYGETCPQLPAAGCGNPRLMELLDVLVGEMAQAKVPDLLAAVAGKKEDFIRAHVVRELVALGGAGFGEFLSALAVYRIPVSAAGVEKIGACLGRSESGALLERAVALGLVERDEARGVFGVTPLLREELLAKSAEQESLHGAAFGYFGEICLANEKEKKFDAVLVEELVYHALACGKEEVAAGWGGRLVTHLRDSLAFAESRRVGEWVLTEKKQPLGNRDDAFLLNATGVTFWNMGDNRKAIEYYEQALDIYKKIHGESHQYTAAALNNLGTAWGALGENRKAIDYFEQALEIWMEAYGEKHQNVAVCLNNLGIARNTLSEHRKAIEYFEQALEIDREVSGNRHPDVSRDLNSLGGACYALGEHRKAIEYYEQALEILKEVYGEIHPHVAGSLNNLGAAWDDLGEHRKAIEYYEQTLEIDREVSGNRHPNVAYGLNNLGAVYFKLEKIETAKEFLQQAYDIRMEFFGPEHPLTKTTAEWLEEARQKEEG
ncbi:MAG: tetratricopeptide repeat protein, partial [bacterium]|nr:tetratricopeptide repeat protein [bacterium]